MRATPASTDTRALRSREQIFAALHEAGREGNLSTLSALSAAAGVTRATIYNHFETLEEAAWFAVRRSLERLVDADAAQRHHGLPPDVVGVDSLRKVIEFLREEESLVRVADTYRSDAALPGLAGILLGTVERFRADFPPATTTEPDTSTEAAAQDSYVAGGLYAVMSTGAWGQRDPAEIAAVAYSLLPEWMRRPGTPSA